MQQGNPAASMYEVGPAGDAGDAVMARWLQSAGLQHLASPVAPPPDQRLLPNLLMQGYGPQSAEEKQRLFKLMRNLNFNADAGLEPYTPTSQSFGGGGLGGMDGFYSPELRGEFGAGLLDLHAMDDTELLTEHVLTEPFEPSPFMQSGGLDDEIDEVSNRQQIIETDKSTSSTTEKEAPAKENNVAKIKVVIILLELEGVFVLQKI